MWGLGWGAWAGGPGLGAWAGGLGLCRGPGPGPGGLGLGQGWGAWTRGPGPGGYGRTDARTYGWTDGQNTPCILQNIAPLELLPKKEQGKVTADHPWTTGSFLPLFSTFLHSFFFSSPSFHSYFLSFLLSFFPFYLPFGHRPLVHAPQPPGLAPAPGPWLQPIKGPQGAEKQRKLPCVDP